MAKSFSVFVEINGKLGASLSQAINLAESQLKRLSNVYKANALAAKSQLAEIADSYKGIAKLAAAGGVVFSVKHAFEGGAELAHELSNLKNAGRTAQEVADGLKAANQTIRDMPTASLTNSVKLLNETTGAYGDFKHAVENLGFNSKLGDILKNSLKVEDPAHELGSLVKTLEIRGAAGNAERYKEEAAKLGQAMVFYGGRLKSDDLYTFASNAATGIKQLDDRFLTRIAPALIQEQGGDKVGTGLTAFRTIISGRKITDKKQAEAWRKLGLLNDKDLIKNKMGDVTGWKDGAIAGTNTAYADPFDFMEKVILPRLQTQGVDINDQVKLGQALNTLFKNTKANAFVTMLSTQMDILRLHKDEDLMNKVPDLGQIYNDSLLNDPLMAQEAIKSAMSNIGSALTLPLMKPFAQTMISVASAVNKLSAALTDNPGTAALIAKIGAGLMAWQAIRFANLVFGIGAMARVIGSLSLAVPLELAARLLATSRAVIDFAVASRSATSLRATAGAMWAMSLAATTTLPIRLRAIAAGLSALYTVGGARLAMATIAAPLVRLGQAVVMFPLAKLGSIAVRMRALTAGTMALQAVGGKGAISSAVGASLVAFGAAILRFPWAAMARIGSVLLGLAELDPAVLVVTAIVGGLTAFGVWVYNNWSGIVSFFGAFGESFMKALGPRQSAMISTVVGWLGAAWRWVSKLLGPLDETGEKWKSWGASAGNAVASVVNAFTAIPNLIADVVEKAFDILVKFDWAAAGRTIASKIGAGLSGLGGYLVDKLNPFRPSPALPKLGTAMPLAGARALGGPVTKGLPYLVGERGPEIFVPEKTGTIETNGVLKNLANGGRGGGALAIGVDSRSVDEAGRRAKRAGELLRTGLDTAVMPVVYTGAIDEATRRAEKLRATLDAIEKSSILVASNGNLAGLGGLGGVGVGGGGDFGLGGGVGGDDEGSGGGSNGGGGGGRAPHERIARAARKTGDAKSTSSGSHRAKNGSSRQGGKPESPVELSGDSVQRSMALVKRYEGFLNHAKWDVNHYRLGYGSDTKTDEHGGVHEVHSGDRTTRAEADRDLARRVPIFMKRLANQVGVKHWAALSPNAQAALTSVGYNYGSFAKLGALRAAIATEDPHRISKAVAALQGHNGGVNRKRRLSEAAMIEHGGGAQAIAKATAPSPLKIAGARAMGGPVGAGLSYLVGERGPEIFTPGASGGISTNAALGRLADVRRAVTEGTGQPIAPDPQRVAQASRPERDAQSVDRSFHAGNHTWNINGGNDPHEIGRVVESKFMDFIREMESAQSGSLSD